MNTRNTLKIQTYKRILICFTLFFLICGLAYADPPNVDPSQFESTTNGFQHFYLNLVPYIHKVVTDSTLTDFSITLWKFFAVMLLVWQLSMYALGTLEITDFFTTIFMICITHVLMQQYDNITTTLWGWSEAFATSIQTSAIGVGDEFFAPRYIWNLITSFSWSAENLLLHPQNVVAAIVLSLASVLVCILAFFTSVWALWGYSLAKIIGLMFVPTILFERLSWLFDGWLRFFFGFLLYNVVAKAGLMLVLISLSAYFSLPADQIPQHMGYQFIFNSLTDVLGLVVFLFIAIIGLFSTGMFVKSIVSGSHTGSFVGGASSLQNTIAKGASHIAGLLK